MITVLIQVGDESPVNMGEAHIVEFESKRGKGLALEITDSTGKHALTIGGKTYLVSSRQWPATAFTVKDSANGNVNVVNPKRRIIA